MERLNSAELEELAQSVLSPEQLALVDQLSADNFSWEDIDPDVLSVEEWTDLALSLQGMEQIGLPDIAKRIQHVLEGHGLISEAEFLRLFD